MQLSFFNRLLPVLLVAALAGASLSSCTLLQRGSRSNQAAAMLPAGSPDAAAQGAPLRPGDTFEINVSGPSPEYTQEFRSIPSYTVSENGSINVPLLGLMQVGGMTGGQLARAIEQRLVQGGFLTMASVNVNTVGQSRLVTIGGSVRMPNAIPWTADMTLSSAIKRVGGPTEFGNLKKVRVTRGGKTVVFNQKIYEKDPSQNPKLLPGDEVEVTE